MTAYDGAMAGVVVLGMIWGAWRGLTWQLAGIASLTFGFVAARSASEGLAPHFPGEPIVARALAMLVVYVAVSGGIFGIAWMIRATLKRLKFEAFDRHLGMVFGGLEGGLLGVVITLFVVSLAPSSREPIFESSAGRLVGGLMSSVGPTLPAEVRDVLAPFWTGEPAAGPTPSLARAAAESERRTADVSDAALDAVRDEFDGLRRSAGRSIGRAIEGGESDPIRELYEEGRARLGRAAGRALDESWLDLDLQPASGPAPKGRVHEPDRDARHR